MQGLSRYQARGFSLFVPIVASLRSSHIGRRSAPGNFIRCAFRNHPGPNGVRGLHRDIPDARPIPAAIP